MDKLKMHSLDKIEANIEAVGKLFPSAATEVIKGCHADGSPILARAIDFDVLRQELSDVAVEGPAERYQFTWPDKRKSILLANSPIAKTLRPCRAESVHFDTTENLYIEGDNLDALKLLQETYLGKVKLIYIDPPYNTGNDFVYEDDFSQLERDYRPGSGQFDEAGNRLVANPESNGRFHTNWLNMIYPRLKLAKDLLRDDGFIFISIDANEFENMTKVANEIFGRPNLRNCIAVRRGIKNVQAQFATLSSLAQGHEYILLYSKSTGSKLPKLYTPLDQKQSGKWDTFWRGTDRHTMRYDLFGVAPSKGQWRWERGRAYAAKENYEQYLAMYSETMSIDDYYAFNLESSGSRMDFVRNVDGKIQYYVPPQEGKLLSDNWMDMLLSGSETVFDTEKSIDIMLRIIRWIASDNDIIFDFFSGSATTAHAVMQCNAEDGGNRKFIMVQLPEATDENSEAYQAGYKNICEIGKDRLRRVGKQMIEELPEAADQPDIGFRVLKVDSTNMKDVYYNPAEYTQNQLELFADNIKADRTAEDLLFQVMLELGIMLSSQIEEITIDHKQVFHVANGYLLACFDKDVSSETVAGIAKHKPYYAVFRDSGIVNDSVATNFEQIFATYSPTTVRKVL